MRHLVNVSGGAGSAVALFRVIDRYGRENVSASLADTNTEHPDLYRFVDDLERAAGIEIVRLKNDGLTIWDVFFREMMLTNKNGGCLAAWHLKRIPLDKHALSLGPAESLTIHIGFTRDEDDRIARLLEARSQPDSQPWTFDFPLTWEPPLFRCQIEKELRQRGIEPCVVYQAGYPHANCLRLNCIKSGIGQWIGVLKDNPAGYAESEENEQRFMVELERRGRKVHTILRDRTGGETKNLSLRELREEVESGRIAMRSIPKWRESSCACLTLFD